MVHWGFLILAFFVGVAVCLGAITLWALNSVSEVEFFSWLYKKGKKE